MTEIREEALLDLLGIQCRCDRVDLHLDGRRIRKGIDGQLE